MPSVQELYELWAGDSELHVELQRSLEPRGKDWLFDAFAALGPRPGQLLADVGARDARHTISLVRDHGLRAVAIDPLPLHVDLARRAVADADLEGAIEVLEGAVEALPLDDASVDWIWCRDVLVHADVRRGLAECTRVLRPGGAVLAYLTLATPRLEPREAEEICRAVAVVPESLDETVVEAAARDAGLTLASVERLGSEWRERMIEDGDWDPAADLLRLARLRRCEAELRERHGAATVEAYAGGKLWGIYQLLGKLRPTVYVWSRRG
jgi:SAM-dependent methyltransferase